MSPGPIQLDQATALTLMLGPNGSVGIQASLKRTIPKLVGSKNSCRSPMVIFQQPAQPFPTTNGAFDPMCLFTGREQQ